MRQNPITHTLQVTLAGPYMKKNWIDYSREQGFLSVSEMVRTVVQLRINSDAGQDPIPVLPPARPEQEESLRAENGALRAENESLVGKVHRLERLLEQSAPKTDSRILLNLQRQPGRWVTLEELIASLSITGTLATASKRVYDTLTDALAQGLVECNKFQTRWRWIGYDGD